MKGEIESNKIKTMEQVQFIDYNETTGVGDLLFVNTNKLNQYRFYRRRNGWDKCYMVEFCADSSDYQFYWGHNDFERSKIDPTGLLLSQDPKNEWKRLKIVFFAFNLRQIVESIENTIGG